MWGGIAVGAAFYVLFGIAPAVANRAGIVHELFGLTGFADIVRRAIKLHGAVHDRRRRALFPALSTRSFFVVGVTVVQNVVAMLLAHRLQGKDKTATLLRVLAFFPIVLGVTVVGIVWLLLFDPLSSPAQALFGVFGIQSAFFGSNIVAMPLVIIVQVWQNLGFTMVVFIGSLKMIPRSIYEAAGLDGVTPWKRFTTITWPMMAPAVTVNVLFAVIGSLTTYNLIYILTDGDFGTNTLGMLAFNSAFGATADLGLGAAVTVALLVSRYLHRGPLGLIAPVQRT